MAEQGPLIVRRAALEAILRDLDVAAILEPAFVAYSQGRAQVTAVGELLFADPPGDVHVKAGHIGGAADFVVKVASGFYDNPKLGLSSSGGLVLVFDARTGRPRAILLDDGLLTDERTAAAGALAARWLAPSPSAIAILGAGVQGRLQLKHLALATPCRRVRIWARRVEAARALAEEAAGWGFEAGVAASPADAAHGADLIVTATPSTKPLLSARDIAPGAHITAVGADGPHKQELAVDLLARADLLVADSLSQCRERGELRRAPEGAPRVELGEIIGGRAPGRTSAGQITIADLTGLAVQDCAIAAAVLAAIEERPPP